jgi:hypothetical protein
MEAVMYTPTADKAKMMIVGSNWDMDNGGYVSPYILEHTEHLYTQTKKEAHKSLNDQVEV